MFIFVIHRDVPELSLNRVSSTLSEDLSEEKTLLVNPDCPVRIMLEYIRKKCKLGLFTSFDLCDETGALKGLFTLPTYVYATDLFVHKQTYYIIVIRTDDKERRGSTLPQLCHDNKLYPILKEKTKNLILAASTGSPPTSSIVTPPKKK